MLPAVRFHECWVRLRLELPWLPSEVPRTHKRTVPCHFHRDLVRVLTCTRSSSWKASSDQTKEISGTGPCCFDSVARGIVAIAATSICSPRHSLAGTSLQGRHLAVAHAKFRHMLVWCTPAFRQLHNVQPARSSSNWSFPADKINARHLADGLTASEAKSLLTWCGK